MAKRRVVRRSRGKRASGEFLAGIALAFAVFSLLSIYQPQSYGALGKMLSFGLIQLFGQRAKIMIIGLGLSSAYFIIARKGRLRVSLNILLLCLLILTIWHLSLPAVQRETMGTWDGQGSGAVGASLSYVLIGLFGEKGARFPLVAAVFFTVLGITDISVRSLWQYCSKLVSQFFNWTVQTAATREEEISHTSFPELLPEPQPMNDPVQLNEMSAEEEIAIPLPAPVERSETPRADWRVEQLPLPAHEYLLPNLSLLNRGLRHGGGRGSRDEKENIRILEDTLANFAIKAKVVDVTRGPTYTRYEIQTAPGTKVSKVTSLSNDLAMSMASEGVRIEAPIPGKAAIGIEVPNKARTAVTLRDVLESSEFANSASSLTVALGKDIEGTTVVADLSQMPHLLIAGATGAGKSVCINALICSILYKATPDQVKFMLIDPKVVELATYNGIPHLLAPVLNHPKKAAAALKWATQEMERRYALFARTGVRDIERYNEASQEKSLERMPHVVIIIDELADLMMIAKADVEDAICRLAQMARAAGMHLVVGTQRPSTDVITGLIKANIPSRLSFTVSSSTDSRVILDISGAEKLLGRGDMLFLPVGLSKPKRIQGAYVSNREIEKIVDHVSTQGEAQYVQVLNTLDEFDGGQSSDGDLDERFDEAVKVVAEAGQASVSMLQRRMRLGYTRAARIVDQMFDMGIVGPSEGSKPRQVNKNHEMIKALATREKGQAE